MHFYVFFYSQLGFFKSKYKRMINENEEDSPGPGTDAAAKSAE